MTASWPKACLSFFSTSAAPRNAAGLGIGHRRCAGGVQAVRPPEGHPARKCGLLSPIGDDLLGRAQRIGNGLGAFTPVGHQRDVGMQNIALRARLLPDDGFQVRPPLPGEGDRKSRTSTRHASEVPGRQH